MLESALASFRQLPFLAQWTVLSLAKAFGGSLALAFAANYATAFFAVRHGFRVPLEGVPYLSFAVGIVGFAAFLLAMPLFLLFVAVAQYLRHALRLRAHSNRQARAFTYLVAAMLGVVFCLNVAWLVDDEFARLVVVHVLPPSFPSERIRLVAGAMMSATFFALLVIWTVGRGYGWVGAQLQAWVVVLLVMLVGLFWHDCYGSFLRLIRYGGGIEVTIKRSPLTLVSGEPAEYNAKLLWMTESHVVLFDSEANVAEEVPRSHIASIIYAPVPPWKLPERVLDKQSDYFLLHSSP